VKKIFLLLFFIALHIHAFTQSLFVKQLQAGDYSQGFISRLVDGNFAVLCSSVQWNQHSEAVLIMDQGFNISLHSLLWSEYYASNWRLFPTRDTGYFVLGNYFEKIDHAGNVQFELNVIDVGGSSVYFTDGAQTPDGGYILAGLAQDSILNERYEIVKLDSSGNISWIKSTTNSDYAFSVILSINDDTTVTVHSYNDSDKSVVTKFGLTGNIVWSKGFDGGGGPAWALNHRLLSDGGYIMTVGGTIMKTDSLLVPEWKMNYSHNGIHITAYFVTDANDGSGFLISGEYLLGNWKKPVLIKTDLNGQPVWGKVFEDIRTITAFCEANDVGKSILLTGDSIGGHLLLFKLDSVGTSCISNSISISGSSDQLPFVSNYSNYLTFQGFPGSATLFQSTAIPNESDYCLLLSGDEKEKENSFIITPNPTSSTFTISSFTQLQNAQIEIYNLPGEKIYSAVYCGPLTVDCRLFPPGIYFVKLQSEKGSEVQKLIVQ
jgi:hypothetical protein